MGRNLWRYGGVVFSHAVFLALLEKELPRDEAYAAVQSAAMEALDTDGDFRALVAARGWLDPARLERCFDLTPYLRHVPMIIDRVLAGEPAPHRQPASGR
jgi:adenylosuccinate lyase